jgi:hypothetical protein
VVCFAPICCTPANPFSSVCIPYFTSPPMTAHHISVFIFTPESCISHLCLFAPSPVCAYLISHVCAFCVSICNAKHCLYRFVSVCWSQSPHYTYIANFSLCLIEILLPHHNICTFLSFAHYQCLYNTSLCLHLVYTLSVCLHHPICVLVCTAKRLLIPFCCLLHHNACTSLFVTLTLPIDCIRPLCVYLQLPMPVHFFLFVHYQCLNIFFGVTAHYSLCLFAPSPVCVCFCAAKWVLTSLCCL